MRLLNLPLIAVLGSGCAFFGLADKSKAPAKATPEQEEKLREIGGEQLVTDVRFVQDLPEKGESGEYQIHQCMNQYLYGHKHLKEGKDSSARGNFLSCEKMCAAASKYGDDKYLEFTSRYVDDCGARRNKLEGAGHLARARKKMDDFEKATGAMNWYYRDNEVRGAFKQAGEELGEDDEGLVALMAEYETLKEGREDELQRARDFMSSAEIIDLNRRRDDIRAQISGLEKDAQYSETAKVLLGQRKRDLRVLDQEFSTKWQATKP